MSTKVWNPYLESYLEFFGTELSPSDWNSHLDVIAKTPDLFQKRFDTIDQYAFAVPNQDAIQELVNHGPLFEIGCGLAYWAKMVQDSGGDIIPYDFNVNEHGNVKFYTSDDYAPPHTQVFKGGPEVAKIHSDRTLFLCWPPYDTPMAYECLKNYLDSGGQRLIYVGEGASGCTGDDAFHNLIAERMSLYHYVVIPVWPNIRDAMNIYTVRG